MPSTRDYQAALRQIEWALAQARADQQLSVLKSEIAKLPPDLRPIVEDSVLMGVRAQQLEDTARRGRIKRFERIGAAGSGAAFIILIVAIALFVPNPTPFQYNVFRIVLALAAGSFTALIPGFLTVDVGNWLKAGGAMAVFVIVFFWNPAQLVTSNTANTQNSAPASTPQQH